MGKEDSAVIYIPAMPNTPVNAEYIQKQKESFLQGAAPPDFQPGRSEASHVGGGKADDIKDPIAKRAMGFAVEVA